MTAELAFDDAELTLLAHIAGRPAFPNADDRMLERSDEERVLIGLRERGVLSGRAASVIEPAVERVLEVVMSRERSLWRTVVRSPAPGEREGTAQDEQLWIRGDEVVRSIPGKVKRFARCEPTIRADWLEEALGFPSGQGSESGPQVRLDREEHLATLDLLLDAGIEAASARCPQLAGYYAAGAGGSDSLYLVAMTYDGDAIDRVEELAVMDSGRHGLWLDRVGRREARSRSIVVERVTLGKAREALAEFFEHLG